MVRTLAPATPQHDNWEALLLEGIADVVVLASAPTDGDQPDGVAVDERRADQIRKLMQEGVPILAVHPCCDSLLAYEVDMAIRDQGRIVVPYLPGVEHPVFEQMLDLTTAEASPLGTVEQIVFERSLVDRERGEVLRQFTRDLPLLRRLLHGIQKLAASGPRTEMMVDPLGPKRHERFSLSNLHVTLSGPPLYPARWSVGPASEADSWRLVVIGSRRRAILEPDATGAWQLHIDGADTITADAWADLAPTWQNVRQALSGDPLPCRAWTALCHDFDAVSSIDRSIRRGRTIELIAEEQTEADSFKGVMAVGGCLTLTVALVVILVAAVIEGLNLPIGAWRGWPLFILLPLVVFLVLQLLGFVVRPASKSTAPSADENGGPGTK
jgi:hypothetical protein